MNIAHESISLYSIHGDQTVISPISPVSPILPVSAASPISPISVISEVSTSPLVVKKQHVDLYRALDLPQSPYMNIYKKRPTVPLITTISPKQYPPVSLTGNLTIVSGETYGNGDYIVSSSNEHDFPYRLLCEDDYWASYIKNGDWIQIKIPHPIFLDSWVLAPRTFFVNRMPNIFQLLGSNDEETWDVIDSYTINNWEIGKKNTFKVENCKSYCYFRIVFTEDKLINIGECKLYGFTEREISKF
jgi:hypothetical protein